MTLLPTPSAWDGRGSRKQAAGKTTKAQIGLENVVKTLLPTPTSRDHKGSSEGFQSRRDGGRDLPGAVKLLPTPLTTDAHGAGAHGVGGRDLRTAVRHAEEVAGWGEYMTAIRTWEGVTDAPVPAPVELGTRGNPRLSARFSEWMMGWPAGWVTDLITTNRKLYREGLISRSAGMKMIGNGVVPQQAAAAISELLADW